RYPPEQQAPPAVVHSVPHHPARQPEALRHSSSVSTVGQALDSDPAASVWPSIPCLDCCLRPATMPPACAKNLERSVSPLLWVQTAYEDDGWVVQWRGQGPGRFLLHAVALQAN